MNKSLIIIGGGIAGLSAGCYGQMNGYETQIFEMHNKPGGLCTAWERKGYTIDLCLHWLVGSAPGLGLYQIWQELGVLQGQRIINLEEFGRFEDVRGRAFDLYMDVDRLEQHMLDLAPEDSKIIHDFAGVIRHFTRFNMSRAKAPELYNLADRLRMIYQMLPFFKDMGKWGRMSISDFASLFKNPLLRNAWQNFWEPDMGILFMIMTFAWFHQKIAGYIIGGSMKLSRAVEKRYVGLGGKINYKSPVIEILLDNDRAVGVKLTDGSEHRADYVISAADGNATIFDMLKGKYISDEIRYYYEKLPIFSPLIFVGLGVNRLFNDIPETLSGITFEFENPVIIGGKERRRLTVRIHSYDPTLAPQGKTLLTLMINSDYQYWESLHNDISQYKIEKGKTVDTIINVLEKCFPGISSQVEMWDVATPVTFRRYTGNWQGSYEGWLPTGETLRMRMSKTLPGLDSLYMIGQWVQPGGGLPSGAITGRHVVQIICKRDNKRFVTFVPSSS